MRYLIERVKSTKIDNSLNKYIRYQQVFMRISDVKNTVELLWQRQVSVGVPGKNSYLIGWARPLHEGAIRSILCSILVPLYTVGLHIF